MVSLLQNVYLIDHQYQQVGSVPKHIVIGAARLGFDSRPDKIGQNVANGSLPLRCFLGTVLTRIWWRFDFDCYQCKGPTFLRSGTHFKSFRKYLLDKMATCCYCVSSSDVVDNIFYFLKGVGSCLSNFQIRTYLRSGFPAFFFSMHKWLSWQLSSFETMLFALI